MDDEIDEYPHGDDDHLDNNDGYAHDNGDEMSIRHSMVMVMVMVIVQS